MSKKYINILLEDIFDESQESKSISSAKKYLMQRGYGEEEADKFIRENLRNTFPALKTKKGGKFILGMARIFLASMENLTTANIIALNNILKLIIEGHYDEYDRNLNGLNAGKLLKQFSMSTSKDNQYTSNDLNDFKHNAYYEIIPINSFKEAKKFSPYTDWCITNNENMYNTYTANGLNQFYFCLKNGFQNVPKEQGPNSPKDEYGLSMLAVCVDENGKLYTCTSRWNHDCGADDSIMNIKEITQVIGRNFYDVFKPNNVFEKTLSNIQSRIKNGEPIENIFDTVGEFYNGIANVSLSDKCNWIYENGEIFYPEMWFDTTDPFINGFAAISLKHEWNFMNLKKELCSKEWFDDIESVFSTNGIALVNKEGRTCYLSKTGIVFPQKIEIDGIFDKDEESGLTMVRNPKGKYNFVTTEGDALSKIWFDDIDVFTEGFSLVELKKKTNFMNKNGEMLSKKWFDSAWPFDNGVAYVEINGEDYELTTDGTLRKEEDVLFNESISLDIKKARKNTDKAPSEGQKRAGNYRKGTLTINGFKITLETPKGSYRKGKDKDGSEWKIKMNNDYGYFNNSLGYDGDHVDVFIGDNYESEKIFVIDQKIGGKFDESKVMFCFKTAKEAKKAYLSNYEKGWNGFDKITEVDKDLFKQWLYDGKKQKKAFCQYKEVKKEGKIMKENVLREFIRESIKKVIIKEGRESTKLTNKLINHLYKISQPYTSKKYQDDDWRYLRGFIEFLKGSEGVESLDFIDGTGRYHSINGSTYKEYNVAINTDYGTIIKGNIRCNFCGTIEDPWSAYDITVNFYRDSNIEESNLKKHNLITEKRGLNSQKLYDLVKSHGGFDKNVHNFYLNSLSDDDVIGEVEADDLDKIFNAYPKERIEWAKEKGYNIEQGDNVELLPLKDQTWIAIIERGALLNDRDYVKTPVGSLKTNRNRLRSKLDGARNYRWQDTNGWGSNRQQDFTTKQIANHMIQQFKNKKKGE